MTTINRPLTGWAPILGDWDLSDKEAIHLGSPASQRGILLGPTRLGNGTVAAGIALSEDSEFAGILLGYSTSGSSSVIAGIGGYGEAYTISILDPAIGPRKLAGAGSRFNLDPARPYAVEVTLEGQRIGLTVDEVRVLDYTLPQPLATEQVGVFAWGADNVAFAPVAISASPPSAFVVMQFTSPFNELYAEVIGPVCAEHGIEAYRASDIYRPGVVIQDIIQGLAEAQVVIAEITPANPNVFYEVGYAHALHKPTILLANRSEISELPFDLRGFRVVFYDDTISGKSSIESDLRQHLRAITAIKEVMR